MKRKEIKLQIRNLMKTSPDRWSFTGILFVIAIIIGLVTGTFIGALLLGGLLIIAQVRTTRNFVEKQEVNFNKSFDVVNRFGDAIIANLLVSVFIFLWSLLFIIPGIIAYYRYELTFYLLEADPSLSGSEAFNKSKQLMKGHKWDSFVFDLSFIGWYLLDVLTLGLLGILFVAPYHAASKYTFLKQIMEPETPVVEEKVVVDEQ